ncbi:MAG: hypothetical protein R3185_03520 [Candidatus Thermoplasmatota archaeon]|nr:hypothetical protein [Candidatus Thermoplasmatota archaeon]
MTPGPPPYGHLFRRGQIPDGVPLSAPTPLQLGATTNAPTQGRAEAVLSWVYAFQNGDEDGLRALSTDGFEFDHHAGPHPMPLPTTIRLSRALAEALPDLHIQVVEIEEREHGIRGLWRWQGTQSEPLDLSFLGVPRIPALGTNVDLPVDRVSWELEGTRVHRLHLHPSPRGGLGGLLGQLGIPFPLPDSSIRVADEG